MEVSRTSRRAFGLDTPTGESASVISTGFEGLIRLGYPVVHNDLAFIEPYVGAGLGWTLYNVAGVDEEDAGVENNDGVMAFPLAIGVGGGYKHFTADVRLMYRPTVFDDMFPDFSSDGTSGEDTLSVSGLIG